MIMNMIARVLLIIGGLNYLRFGKRFPFALLIGLSALYLGLNRDFYLPFLGACAMPGNANLYASETNNTNKSLVTYKLKDLPPNVRVVVWGAGDVRKTYSNPADAYGDYSNTVWTKSDEAGTAQVQMKLPGSYSVKSFGVWKKDLASHIHYRYEDPKYQGLFSRVFTLQV